MECVECLVCVPDEWKAHLSLLVIRHGTSLGTVNGSGVLLRNLVNGEVRHINVRAKLRLEGSTNVAELCPNDATEEWVVFDLRGAPVLATVASNTVFSIT